MKDCCDNCKEGKECCSANEANTKSIDGKALYDFLQKRFKMSKSKAIATMKKHKMDMSFLKNESVKEGGPGSGKPKDGSSKDKEELERKAKEQAKKDMEDEFDFDFDESVNEGQRAFLAYRKMKEGIEDTIKGIRIFRGHIDNAPYNKKFSLMTSELYKFQIDMEKKLHKFIPQISKLSKDKLLESWSTGLERYKVTLENGEDIDVKVKEGKGLEGLEELLKKEGLKFDKITKKASRPTLTSEPVNEDNFRSRAIDDIDEIHTSVKYLASKIAKEDRKHGTKATREYIKFYKQHFMKFYTGVTKSAFNLLADGVIKKESVNEGTKAFLAYRKMKEGIEDIITGIKILRGHIDNAPYNKKFSLMTSELYKFQIDMEKKLYKFIPQMARLSKDKLLESWSTGLERYKVTLENGEDIDVKVKEGKGLEGLEELLKKEGLKFDKITKKASRPTLTAESTNEGGPGSGKPKDGSSKEKSKKDKEEMERKAKEQAKKDMEDEFDFDFDESVNEGTQSIDGEVLMKFLMKRFKMSKSKAIATMKKHKMDMSFLKKEGFGGELKGKDKKQFEKARKENAEVLGYELTGTKDIKESSSAYGKSIEKIANNKKLKSISKKDRDTLMRIAKLMKKSNESVNEADVSALKAKMAKQMDMVKKHRESMKKHSGKDKDKADRALARMKAAQAKVDDTQDKIIGIKNESVNEKMDREQFQDYIQYVLKTQFKTPEEKKMKKSIIKKLNIANKKKGLPLFKEAVEPKGNMAKIAKVVTDKQHTKLGGVLIDGQSANLLMKLFNAVSDKDKEKMNKLNAKMLTTVIKRLWSRINLKLPI